MYAYNKTTQSRETPSKTLHRKPKLLQRNRAVGHVITPVPRSDCTEIYELSLCGDQSLVE